jgi:hypothetical protein
VAEHLSALVLDELAAGAGGPDAAQHLATCAECRHRLDQRRSAAAEILSRPDSARVWARITAASDRPARTSLPRRRWLALAGGLAAAAATGVVLVSRGPGDRLKGSPTLAFVRASDGTKAASARPGDRLQLELGAAGHAYALLLAVDASGAATPRWPAGARESGPAPRGIARLAPAFEVTPGSLVVHAFLSARPLAVEPVLRALAAAAQQAGGAPLDAGPPALGDAQASAKLTVTP